MGWVEAAVLLVWVEATVLFVCGVDSAFFTAQWVQILLQVAVSSTPWLCSGPSIAT